MKQQPVLGDKWAELNVEQDILQLGTLVKRKLDKKGFSLKEDNPNPVNDLLAYYICLFPTWMGEIISKGAFLDKTKETNLEKLQKTNMLFSMLAFDDRDKQNFQSEFKEKFFNKLINPNEGEFGTYITSLDSNVSEVLLAHALSADQLLTLVQFNAAYLCIVVNSPLCLAKILQSETALLAVLTDHQNGTTEADRAASDLKINTLFNSLSEYLTGHPKPVVADDKADDQQKAAAELDALIRGFCFRYLKDISYDITSVDYVLKQFPGLVTVVLQSPEENMRCAGLHFDLLCDTINPAKRDGQEDAAVSEQNMVTELFKGISDAKTFGVKIKSEYFMRMLINGRADKVIAAVPGCEKFFAAQFKAMTETKDRKQAIRDLLAHKDLNEVGFLKLLNHPDVQDNLDLKLEENTNLVLLMAASRKQAVFDLVRDVYVSAVTQANLENAIEHIDTALAGNLLFTAMLSGDGLALVNGLEKICTALSRSVRESVFHGIKEITADENLLSANKEAVTFLFVTESTRQHLFLIDDLPANNYVNLINVCGAEVVPVLCEVLRGEETFSETVKNFLRHSASKVNVAEFFEALNDDANQSLRAVVQYEDADKERIKKLIEAKSQPVDPSTAKKEEDKQEPAVDPSATKKEEDKQEPAIDPSDAKKEEDKQEPAVDLSTAKKEDKQSAPPTPPPVPTVKDLAEASKKTVTQASGDVNETTDQPKSQVPAKQSDEGDELAKKLAAQKAKVDQAEKANQQVTFPAANTADASADVAETPAGTTTKPSNQIAESTKKVIDQRMQSDSSLAKKAAEHEEPTYNPPGSFDTPIKSDIQLPEQTSEAEKAPTETAEQQQVGTTNVVQEKDTGSTESITNTTSGDVASDAALVEKESTTGEKEGGKSAESDVPPVENLSDDSSIPPLVVNKKGETEQVKQKETTAAVSKEGAQQRQSTDEESKEEKAPWYTKVAASVKSAFTMDGKKSPEKETSTEVEQPVPTEISTTPSRNAIKEGKVANEVAKFEGDQPEEKQQGEEVKSEQKEAVTNTDSQKTEATGATTPATATEQKVVEQKQESTVTSAPQPQPQAPVVVAPPVEDDNDSSEDLELFLGVGNEPKVTTEQQSQTVPQTEQKVEEAGTPPEQKVEETVTPPEQLQRGSASIDFDLDMNQFGLTTTSTGKIGEEEKSNDKIVIPPQTGNLSLDEAFSMQDELDAQHEQQQGQGATGRTATSGEPGSILSVSQTNDELDRILKGLDDEPNNSPLPTTGTIDTLTAGELDELPTGTPPKSGSPTGQSSSLKDVFDGKGTVDPFDQLFQNAQDNLQKKSASSADLDNPTSQSGNQGSGFGEQEFGQLQTSPTMPLSKPAPQPPVKPVSEKEGDDEKDTAPMKVAGSKRIIPQRNTGGKKPDTRRQQPTDSPILAAQHQQQQQGSLHDPKNDQQTGPGGMGGANK